jgi:hypothetical protein
MIVSGVLEMYSSSAPRLWRHERDFETGEIRRAHSVIHDAVLPPPVSVMIACLPFSVRKLEREVSLSTPLKNGQL